MDRVECIVIGAGIIGLAIARALAQAGREVIVLEAEKQFGSHSSSRNSEVVHAGIYYPCNSLKARLCVAGRKLLYSYCEQNNIPHKRTGKLIVASSANELPQLEQLLEKGRANGVYRLELLDGIAVKALEPALDVDAALHSPNTGIVDSHSLMLSMVDDIEAAGGHIIHDSPLLGARCNEQDNELAIGGNSKIFISCQHVINAAGLKATTVAALLGKADTPAAYFAKGHYFSLSGKAPFQRLVYPLPQSGGLGIHATPDLAGTIRFGPDVVWQDDDNYSFDEAREARFREAIARYYPAIAERELSPGYCGVRPKLSDAGFSDFRIDLPQNSNANAASQTHLFGIESPGLTSSLAIANYVRAALTDR